jgi:hypothetical protein
MRAPPLKNQFYILEQLGISTLPTNLRKWAVSLKHDLASNFRCLNFGYERKIKLLSIQHGEVANYSHLMRFGLCFWCILGCLQSWGGFLWLVGWGAGGEKHQAEVKKKSKYRRHVQLHQAAFDSAFAKRPHMAHDCPKTMVIAVVSEVALGNILNILINFNVQRSKRIKCYPLPTINVRVVHPFISPTNIKMVFPVCSSRDVISDPNK